LVNHYGLPNVRGLLKIIIEERYNDCRIEEQERKRN
jgi:hypothetical protein